MCGSSQSSAPFRALYSCQRIVTAAPGYLAMGLGLPSAVDETDGRKDRGLREGRDI